MRPAVAAVAGARPVFHVVGHVRLDVRAEGPQHHLPVIGLQQRKPCFGRVLDLVVLVAQALLPLGGDHRRAGRHGPVPHIAGGHREPEAQFAVEQGRLRAPLLLERPGVVERAFHRGRQPAQVMLQDVVRRAALQRLDGVLLADRSRYEDEGNVRAQIARQRQGAHAAEARHAEVRQDHLRQALRDLLPKVGFRLHPAVPAFEGRAPQRAHDQLGVVHLVFDQQDIQWLGHPRPRWLSLAVAGPLRRTWRALVTCAPIHHRRSRPRAEPRSNPAAAPAPRHPAPTAHG